MKVLFDVYIFILECKRKYNRGVKTSQAQQILIFQKRILDL